MLLFVIRHAIAEETAPEGAADTERELTEDGEKRMKQVVKGLREIDWTFDRIVCSPWQRARSTARLLEPLCDDEPTYTELLCQSPRAELLGLLAEQAQPTAIVGHEPWLGELVAWLAFGDTRHGEALQLKKGCVVVLEGSAVPGGMMVRALIPPSVLRAAGA